MLRKKRQVKGLAAIGLAGIMAASLGLAGCGKYESSSEMKARMESDSGAVSQIQDSPAVCGESGAPDERSKAETIKLDLSLIHI